MLFYVISYFLALMLDLYKKEPPTATTAIKTIGIIAFKENGCLKLCPK
jgi:hypothetical protein